MEECIEKIFDELSNQFFSVKHFNEGIICMLVLIAKKLIEILENNGKSLKAMDFESRLKIILKQCPISTIPEQFGVNMVKAIEYD